MLYAIMIHKLSDEIQFDALHFVAYMIASYSYVVKWL